MSTIFETNEYRIKGNENLPYDPSPVVEGHTYDLELDGTQLTLTEDSEDKTTVQIPSSLLGTCTTAAATAAKVVTLSDASGWELKQGASVAVKFSNTNTFSATAQAPITLNVNNTGAKNIYYGGSAHPTGTNTTAFGRANYVNTYVYDGTYWVWAGSSSDNNTTYSAMSQSEANTGTATTARSITASVLKQAIKTHSPSDAYDITHGQSNVGNDLDDLQEAVTDIVNVYGAKNLNGTTYQTKASSGLTWTVNPDGSISVSGTSTGELTNGGEEKFGFVAPITAQVILSGGISNNAHIFPWDVTDNARPYSDSRKTTRATGYVSATNELSFYMEKGHLYRMTLRCYKGTTVNGTFYPMLRLASIQDDTYVPYAKTNKELTDTFTNQVADNDDAYSPSKAYKVGEHCIYNNVLYKCVTACLTAEWSVNQNCFEETTLTSAVTDLNNDLNNFFISNSRTYHSLETDVTYNSSYTAPSDGLYMILLKSTVATSMAGIFTDSNRNNWIAGSDQQTVISVYLKAGTTIYTRNISNTSYKIRGYYE